MKITYQAKTFVLILIFGIISWRCTNDSITDTISDDGSISADAAYTIAVATGEEGGGITEAYSDLLNVQSKGILSPTMTITDGDFETVFSDYGIYKSLTGWWTVKIKRVHRGRVTSFETRTYQYRFRKNSTQFQEYYVVNGDTAVQMEFKIISGTGYFKNPTLTHRLTQLRGSFIVTDINKDTVTITLQNDYIRSGIDSIITKQIPRILTHTVTIFKDRTQIRAPRFLPSSQKSIAHWRNEFHKTVSGIMHGHVSAGVTMSNGEYYAERTIDKDFIVSFAGNKGEGSISLGFNGSLRRFRFNLETDNRN